MIPGVDVSYIDFGQLSLKHHFYVEWLAVQTMYCSSDVEQIKIKNAFESNVMNI